MEAPTRMGNATWPPRSKVKAMGGLPMKMSSSASSRQERGKASHMVMMSRWKCMVPLGWPVVPKVKVMSTTSSRAVSTFSRPAGLVPALSPSSAAAPASPEPLK